MAKKGDDVSRRTIAILLVVAVLISVIGTWLVLTQQPRIEYEQRVGSGIVQFEVMGEPVPPAQVTGNSIVAFEIG